MPNVFKYNPSSTEAKSLRKGNFYIGTGDVGKGPSSETGFYNGVTVGTFSYVMVLHRGDNVPTFYQIQDDEELILRTNQIDKSTVRTTKEECFSYFAGQSDKQRLIGSGQSWSSYWKTLISATVENAAPNDIVLTFTHGRPSLVSTDFAIGIYGNSIASASWAGSILTLTLTLPVVVYNGSFLVTFNKTGQTKAVANNVNDGNTVAWYKHNDPVAGVVINTAPGVNHWLDKFNYALGAEMINQTQWYTPAYWNVFAANWSQVGTTLVSNGSSGNLRKDAFLTVGLTYEYKITVVRNAGTLAILDGATLFFSITASGTYTGCLTATAAFFLYSSTNFDGAITLVSLKRISGNHLIQQTTANKPTWSAANGVLFDGVNDFMKTVAFAFVQPEFIYFVGRQITWTNSDYFIDGGSADRGLIYQSPAANNLRAYAGSFSGAISPPANTFIIIRLLFNGANSSFRYNKEIAVAWDCGVRNMDGFTLGASAPGTSPGNIEVKEIILRRSADNADTQSAIYNYLENINGL